MTAPDTFGQLAARVERLGGVASAILKSQSEMRAALRVATRHELTGSERFVRHAALKICASPMRPVEDVLAEFYGIRVKAATDLGVTTVPEWAGRLVAADALGFLSEPPAPSVLAQLIARGGRAADFNGEPISVPYRRNGDPAGSWVGQGAPIGVIRQLLDSLSLAPQKLGSIAAVSVDLTRSTRNNVEAFVAGQMRADLVQLLDRKMLSADAATATAPAGLLSGLTAIASTGDPVGDLQAITSALLDLGARSVVFIMNPLQALALSTLPNAPAVVQSVDCPAATVIGLDPGAFVAVVDNPEVSTSEETLLHMADPAAALVGGTTSPPQLDDIAAPVRSLWQTNSVGIRTLLDAAFAVAGQRIAYVEDVTW